jgi:hypothetical protein
LPPLLEERNLSRLILSSLPGELRAAGGGRFSDSDLCRIVLGAALGINPFRQLSPIRGLVLVSLLLDLIRAKRLKVAAEVIAVL